MKTSFLSIRKSFFAWVACATLLVSLPTDASSETVHSETYPMGEGSTFLFSFFASHYDYIPPQGWGSNLDVVLSVNVYDKHHNLYSSSSFSAQFSEGEVSVFPSEDVGMSFDWTPIEGGRSFPLAELSVSAEFNPPGELDDDYTVELLLTKYWSDNNDTQTVYVTYEP